MRQSPRSAKLVAERCNSFLLGVHSCDINSHAPTRSSLGPNYCCGFGLGRDPCSPTVDRVRTNSQGGADYFTFGNVCCTASVTSRSDSIGPVVEHSITEPIQLRQNGCNLNSACP